MPRFVFICDIEKMYRQIRMHEDDRDLQRFIWRENESEPLMDYRLSTVTFGQASAPFTATRTLLRVAEVHLSNSIASKILEQDTYVDDLHFGMDEATPLLAAAEELIGVLKAAGFSLRKFSSNSSQFMDSYVDPQGVMRVGGRLSNSNYPYNMQHPIILRSHPIILALVREHHVDVLHRI